MLLRYFMTSDVITLTPDQKCLEAIHLFKEHSIRRAPVLNKNKLVGIVSERDLHSIIPGTLLHASQEIAEASKHMTIKNIMATKVHVLSPNDHIEMASNMMLKHKVGGIPVVADGQIEGIITESDIFKAMWSILSNKTSRRILFFDKDNDTDKLPNDYLELCFKHNCLVQTFISYHEPDGRYMHYLCIQGEGVDNLINNLWAYSCNVIIVDEDNH